MSELREEATSFEIEVDGLGTFTITPKAIGLARFVGASDAKGLPGTDDGWWVYNTCGLRLVEFATKEEATEAIHRVTRKALETKMLWETLTRAERELDSLWCEGAIWK